MDLRPLARGVVQLQVDAQPEVLALLVEQVVHDLEHGPLARRGPPARLLLRAGREPRADLGVAREQRQRLPGPAHGVAPGAAGAASRCTVSGEKAGRHTATYSAPPGSGVLYCTHSPGLVCTAWPAWTSSTRSRVVTRSIPASTTVYSSKSGRW